MPPKKPVAGAKPGAATKAPAKSTTTASKTPAKAAGKTPAKPGAKKEEVKAPPAPAPKPVTFIELVFKEIDAAVVYDKEEKVKASGKWALIVDENGLTPRFLRHRDVNMLTSLDPHDMEPETIRKALLGALRFGKPLILDMMESEMYDFCVDKFSQVQPDLLETILTKAILEEDKYMSLVKEEDDNDFQNKYQYNIANFSFIMTTTLTAPSETLLQKVYPVKVV